MKFHHFFLTILLTLALGTFSAAQQGYNELCSPYCMKRCFDNSNECFAKMCPQICCDRAPKC